MRLQWEAKVGHRKNYSPATLTAPLCKYSGEIKTAWRKLQCCISSIIANLHDSSAQCQASLNPSSPKHCLQGWNYCEIKKKKYIWQHFRGLLCISTPLHCPFSVCQYPGAWTVLFNNNKTWNTLYTVQGKACLEFCQLHWKLTLKISRTLLILVSAASTADLTKGFTGSFPTSTCTNRWDNTNPTVLHLPALVASQGTAPLPGDSQGC